MGALKGLLQKVICGVIPLIFGKMPAKYIYFESAPKFADNTDAVYRYLSENNLLAKYKFVWYDKEKDGTAWGKVMRKYYLSRSRAVIFCNKVFPKERKDQLTIHLCHGSKSKKTRGLYEAPKDLDYILVQADVFKDSLIYEYDLSEKTQLLTLGYPRNDDLLKESGIDREALFGKKFEKLLVWYPTFRQRKEGGRTVSSVSLPIIHNEDAARKLNECAKKERCPLGFKASFCTGCQLHQGH